MNDPHFEPDWAENQAHLNQGIDRFIDKLAFGFKTMQRIQFQAPWRSRDG